MDQSAATIPTATMKQPSDAYRQFTDEGAVTPSSLTAYLPPWANQPDLEDLRERVLGHGRVSSASEVLDPTDHDCGAIACVWGEGENALELRVILRESDAEFDTGLPLSPEELDQAQRSEWCLTVTTYLGDEVLADFHVQLRLLHVVAPEAVAMYDCESFRFHSGRWLREVATSPIPPPPDTLYSVHAVSDASGDGAWVHSHGLHRCGCIELEMLDIPPEELSTYANLFEVAAALLIERGTPPPGEAFEAGYELAIYWLPWEQAIDAGPAEASGRRDDRDEYHDQPSGVLFAALEDEAEGAAPTNVTVYQEILADEPVMFHTQMETRRMSLMAKNRFPRFRAMHRRFPGDEDWLYHVKLGYQIDGCPDYEDDNEHLWFDVHQIHGGELVATLLNQPHHIARMRAGDRDRHAVDQLSDWAIDCPHGLFDPSSIGRLEALLDDDP